MAIDTKPNLAGGKFEQCSGDILNLSGCTQVFGTMDVQPNGVIDSCSGYKVSGTTIFKTGNYISSLQIGQGACATNQNGISIGYCATSTASDGISIGCNSNATGARSLALMGEACASGTDSIAIGRLAKSCTTYAISIGCCSCAMATGSISIGINNSSCSDYGSVIGGCGNVLGALSQFSILLGGSDLKVTGETAYVQTAIVPNLAILCTPEGSGNMLCWDPSTKKVELTPGSVATGDRVSRIITQNNHGFNVWDVVGYRNTSYDKPIADGTYDGEILGIVSKYIDVNTFELTQSGYVSGDTIGFLPDVTYFLSDIAEGFLTDEEPTTHGHISKAILIADSLTSGWVLPYRGYYVTSGETGGGTWGTIVGNLSDQTDLWDKITELSASTTQKYNLTSPAVCSVGGVTAGMVLTGKTAFELIESILVPEICGTLTAPSTTIAISPTTSTYEIGTVIASLSVTGTFNQGCINPQGCSASPKRSGLANQYTFTGCQIVGAYACTAASVVKTVTNYAVCASQAWTVATRYDCGVQPIGSKGTCFGSPLASGTTTAASCTITGIYPYYWGKLTCATRPPVTSALVAAGTKVVASSTGVLQINFSSSSSEWTWLAIPQVTTSKTCWYVNALDNGRVNNTPSDKYPDECQLNVTSAQSCWTNICYKVYMSGTVGAITSTMCFS